MFFILLKTLFAAQIPYFSFNISIEKIPVFTIFLDFSVLMIVFDLNFTMNSPSIKSIFSLFLLFNLFSSIEIDSTYLFKYYWGKEKWLEKKIK